MASILGFFYFAKLPIGDGGISLYEVALVMEDHQKLTFVVILMLERGSWTPPVQVAGHSDM